MTASGDAYCGINCDACSIRRYGETGHADAFVSCCGPVPRSGLVCDGCKSERVYPGCRTCSLRACARKRGVAHCVDCADYPCPDYRKWQGAASLLPHVRESVANLEAIKRDGLQAWLAAQRPRWSCPACGTPFSWYAAECADCGKSLAGLGHRLTGWRKAVCRLVLPMVYWKGRLGQKAASGSGR